MKLHRAQVKPDWFGLTKHNKWQKLAIKTGGIVTPGNLLSVIGFILVVIGLIYLLRAEYGLAIWLIVIGRACDLADGWVADLTGTKSSLGESVDVIIDKLATILMIGALIAVNLIIWWLVLLLVLPQLMIVINSFLKKRRNIRVQPSIYGKVSMALLWLSMVGLIGVHIVDISGIEFFKTASYSLAVASAVLAFIALVEYRQTK